MDDTVGIGEVLTLREADSTVTLTTVGAHLRSFRVGGLDVIVPFGDDLPWGAHGAVLAPWPNRLADGRYTWAGSTHETPITEAARNNALHGLVMDVPWEAERTTPASATLTTTLAPTPSYPFHIRMTLSYRLTGGSLSAEFTAENLGEGEAPFGVGFHPWVFAGPGGVETATLQFGAGSWFATDERLLPTGEGPVPAEFDFSTPRLIGSTRIDDAFGHPVVDDSGRAWVHVTRSDGLRVSTWMSDPFAVWQLCTSPGDAPREGIAVEPMSCPADAFNSGHLLHRLVAGTPFEVRWGMEVTSVVRAT